MKKFFITITILSCFACSNNDYELQKSIFYADPLSPGLPEYSEWGYNTFGAYYERGAFHSNTIDYPLKVVSSNGNTQFTFQGNLSEVSKSGYYYGGDPMSLELNFQGLSYNQYDDLVSLDNVEFDLLDPSVQIIITRGSQSSVGEVLEGTLHFKRSQFLLLDGVQAEVILSGLFEIKLIIDGKPISILNGRFDVGIGESNFYKL